MKAITWLSVRADVKIPIDKKQAPKKNNPMNEPQVPPMSILPFGSPN